MNGCHNGSAAYCQQGLIGPGGQSFTSIVPGNSNITIAVAGGVAQVSSSLNTVFADGTTAQPTTYIMPPGVTNHANGAHIFEGGQAATFVAFPGDGSTAILDVAIVGLNNSSEYTATLTVRVVFLSAATNAIVGSVDFSVDLYVVTDGGGVATVTFQTTPSPDPSRLPATMAQATCTAAALAGGFRISASRHPGYNSLARAFWWVTEWLEL